MQTLIAGTEQLHPLFENVYWYSEIQATLF